VTNAADRRRRVQWLVAALGALLLAWLVTPGVVPIYNGIGNPDEPYRYVKPPASAKTTKQPTSAHKVVPVTGGFSTAAFANTAEVAPQISVYLPPKALQLSSSVTSVDVNVQPLAPTTPLPKDGTIVGNVYRITASATGSTVKVTGSGPSEPSLQMRAPDGRQPGPVFEHLSANGWQRTRTIRVGVDVYQTQAPALGDWALVQLKSSASSSTGGGGGGINWGFLVGGIALLVVAAVVLMIRLRRTSGAMS
jgi:hypothetical protein